jgi:tetratricopeptide (TPR) repeat protein
MALQRKRPLPCNRLSGKRPGLLLAAAMVLALAGLSLATPARAQDDGALSAGANAFSAGKYDTAVKQLSAALRSDGIKPSSAAKALYLRGIAYQKIGQPSRAIADLGAALWLGLSPAERVQALVNRGLAYNAAGLKREAEADLTLARKEDRGGEVDRLVAEGGGATGGTASIAAFSTEVTDERSGRSSPAPSSRPLNTESTPSAPSRTADAAPTEAPSSGGNRVSRWWGSITGSSSDSEPAAPPPAPAKPPAISSDWSTETQPAPGTRVAAASPTAPVGGGYLLQLSPTRSPEEATALWKQVAKANSQLASLQPRIERTDMGNLGTFYRLQIGPFPDKAESLKVCNTLKRSGVDCFLVAP